MSVFMNAFARAGVKQTISTIRNGNNAKNVVEKVLHSRNTLDASDLSGETFTSVLNALKDNGVNNVKLVASKNGGYIVHAKDIDRNTGLINLFPGAVMGPNGKLSVSFKFNSMGDCLQMTGVQKYPGVSVSGSTIRSNTGIANLQKHGMKNPTEYVQVVATKTSKGQPYRFVNKTYSPLENTGKTGGVAGQSASETISQNAGANATKETSDYVGGLKFGRVSAEERKYMRQESMWQGMLDELRVYNPEFADKVSKKIRDMRSKDWDRAEDFANGLVERYSNGQNSLARFEKRIDDIFDSSYFNSSDDFWGKRF